MQKFLIISTIFIFLTSCFDNFRHKQSRQSKIGQTLLSVSFQPAFDENSKVIYSSDEFNRNLSIVIKCKNGPERDIDTFFYKTKILTGDEALLLDSTLVKGIPIPDLDRRGKMVDGITIYFELAKDGDTTYRHFRCPSKDETPTDYLMTQKTIAVFKTVFNDTLISDYFNDIHSYIDDTIILNKPNPRPIVKLRIQKYGWQLR